MAKKSPYGSFSNPASFPPPVGGWNRRDAIPEMDVKDAVVLDNWIPGFGGVSLRKGYSLHASGIAGNYVESLMEYSPPSGTVKLFAAGPDNIYDVTSTATASLAVASASNGRWSHVNFGTAAANVLFICNGVATPKYYNGTAWANTTLTGSGLTTSNLDFVIAHMNRLWFIEKNTLNLWYAATSTIDGASGLTKFSLSSLFKLGGSLAAIGTWTRDGGSGPDDHLVAVTTKGEVAIYAGTDPSSSTTSALIGVYKIAEPIGRRCLLRVGADLGVLTSQGLVPLSQVLPLSESGAAQTAITDKISGAFQEMYRISGTAFGWQVVEYPKDSLAIVNVPVVERGASYQFVINTRTGAWCRFTGISAQCWGVSQGHLYFGGQTGSVWRYGVANADNGTNIVALLQSAYSDFGAPINKQFHMARPRFLAPQGYSPLVTIKTDYDTSPPSVTVIQAPTGGAQWDAPTSLWDVTSWDPGAVPSLPWQSIQGIGMAGSIAFGVAAQSEITYNGADVVYETGGIL